MASMASMAPWHRHTVFIQMFAFQHLSAMAQNVPGTLRPTLVLQLLFTGDEAGYLFGFDGVLLGQLRQYTGADATMTMYGEGNGDGDAYVVRVEGTLETGRHACGLVLAKLRDYAERVLGTRRLVVRIAADDNQCESLVGRVNALRDATGADVSVGRARLPRSGERVVEVAGDGESCLRGALQLCEVLLLHHESPPRPDAAPRWRPVFLCGDGAYVLDGNVARPAPPEALKLELAKGARGAGRRGPDRVLWVGAEAMFRVLARRRGALLVDVERTSGALVRVGGAAEVTPWGDVPVVLSGTEEAVLLARCLLRSTLDDDSDAAGGPDHFRDVGVWQGPFREGRRVR